MSESLPPDPRGYHAHGMDLVPAPYGSQISTIPQVFGWLNVSFGLLLLACGICSGANLFVTSQMMPLIKAQQDQLAAQMDAQRQTEIENLEQQAEEAATEGDREELRARIEEVQNQPAFEPPDMEKMLTGENGSTLAYSMADIISSMILNLGMLVTGIGLLYRKNWGRLGSLGIAALKIIQHIVLLLIWLMVIVPNMSKAMTEMVEQMAAGAPGNGMGAAPPQMAMGAMYSTMLTAQGVMTAAIGMIYPLLSLWFLSRQRTREACTPAIFTAPAATNTMGPS